MSEPKRIAAKLREALGGLFKVKTRQVGGLLGDGTTEQRVIVAGATQRVWFRPDPYPNALWQPIHLKSDVPLFHGMAAIVEFNESDSEWYVQQIDRKKYAEQEDFELRYVPAHARQHSINEDSIPSDPTWIYRRGVVMLRGSVPGDSSLRVFIQPGDLPFTTNTYWPGGFTADQTGNLPAGGNQVWLTISLTSSLTIDVNVGSEFAEGLSLINAPPDPDAGNVPICHVLLSDDTSEIVETIIWDARRTVGTFSDPVVFANPTAQVGLSAINGAAVTAMRSDAAPALDQGIIPTWTGLHTHQADIVMDGADVDLDGEQLVIDEDGDSYLVELVDDVIYLYIGASLTLAYTAAGMAMAASKSISLGGNADALILDLDEDTTISAPTDDQIDIEIGGADQIVLGLSEMAFNEQGADINFRIEGDTDQNLLFVDAGNDRIAIGENTPTAKLTVTENYAGATAKTAATVLTTWTPGVALGTVFPTAMSLVPIINHDDALTSGFLTAFRCFAESAGTVGMILRNVDLLNRNTGSGTVANTTAIQIRPTTNTGGGAITINRGILIQAQTVGGSIYGVVSQIAAAANRWNLYISGTADNYLEGNLGIGAPAPGSKVEIDLATEDFEIVDAGSAGATEQDWVEVQIGGVQGYLRVFAAK